MTYTRTLNDLERDLIEHVKSEGADHYIAKDAIMYMDLDDSEETVEEMYERFEELASKAEQHANLY